MSLDFLTVTEYCNKKAAIRHCLRSEESHDLYPMILEGLSKKSEKWFLKGITTLRELQFCYFDNNFGLSTIPFALIMNKEQIRYFTRLLDSILSETTGSLVKKRKLKTLMHKHCDFCRVSDLPSHPKLMKKHILKKRKVIINKIIIH